MSATNPQSNQNNWYSEYQNALSNGRASLNPVENLFSGWTKAGRCAIAAEQILRELTHYQGAYPEYLTSRIHAIETQIVPYIDKKRERSIREKIEFLMKERLQSDVDELQRKHEELAPILPPSDLKKILEPYTGLKQREALEQIYIFYREKSIPSEHERIKTVFEKMNREAILSFISTANQLKLQFDRGPLIQLIDIGAKGGDFDADLFKTIPEESIPSFIEFIHEIFVNRNQAAKETGTQIKKLFNNRVLKKEEKIKLVKQITDLFVKKPENHHIEISKALKKITERFIHTEQLINLFSLLNRIDFSKENIFDSMKTILSSDIVLESEKMGDWFILCKEKLHSLDYIAQKEGIDAVHLLLDCLREDLSPPLAKEFIGQIERLEGKIPMIQYLKILESIPNKFPFILHLNSILLKEKYFTIESLPEYIENLERIPPRERNGIPEQLEEAMRRIEQFESSYQRIRILKYTRLEALRWISPFPTEELRSSFIRQIPELIDRTRHFSSLGGRNPSIEDQLLWYFFLFPNRPDWKREGNLLREILSDPIQFDPLRGIIFPSPPPFVIAQFLIGAHHLDSHLGKNGISPLDGVRFMKQKIGQAKIGDFLKQISGIGKIFSQTDSMSVQEKLESISFLFDHLPANERFEFADQIGALTVPIDQRRLKTLLSYPPEERRDGVDALNLELELRQAHEARENRPIGTLKIDPGCFSEEQLDPTKPLLKLLDALKSNPRFPKIEYLNSLGQDEGGVARDFITRLFEALSHPNQKKLPFWASSENRHLPLLQEGPPHLPLGKQIDCYKGIGKIFARILNGDSRLELTSDSITIGTHFDPLLFTMIQSLTQSEIDRIPDPIGKNDILPIQHKLTALYLKTRYPNIFQPKEIDPKLVDQEIGDLMEGRISPRLIAFQIEPNFLKDYPISSAIQAALIIAKSMRQSLLLGHKWANVVGRFPGSLRKKIEGSLSPDLAIRAFNLENTNENTREGMVKRWIRGASFEELKNFVFALTGSPTLAFGQKLTIQLANIENGPPPFGAERAPLPVFHTCQQTIDLYNYETYEIFKEKLEKSIEYSIREGFTFL